MGPLGDSYSITIDEDLVTRSKQFIEVQSGSGSASLGHK